MSSPNAGDGDFRRMREWLQSSERDPRVVSKGVGSGGGGGVGGYGLRETRAAVLRAVKSGTIQ